MGGTFLVVGSAPCLHDDIARALAIRPCAQIMLVNGACTAWENAGHMLAGHTNKAELFRAARDTAFPLALPIRIHANWMRLDKGAPRKEYPSVTDWHGPEMSTGATSAAKAARICLRALGAEEVILCGAPMDGSGYAATEAVVPHDCHRVGDASKQDRLSVKGYYRRFAKLAAGEFKGKVFSMSGRTRDLLGEPHGQLGEFRQG